MNFLAILAALGLEQWHAPAWRVSVERAFVRQARALERRFNGGTAGQGAVAAAIAIVPPVAIAGGLWWLSMSLFSGWLLRYDLACRPRVHRFGWALHTARSLRLGYTWLMLAGLWGVVNALRGMPLDSPGPLHMLLLGFVFSMVFGHAPIMLPALLRTPISPPGPFAFVPVGLMTLGVTLRAVGDAIGSGGVRAGAGALQAAAILTFAFTMIRHLRR